MAIFFPSDAKAKDTPGGPEQKVLDALKKLDDSWYVIPNLNIANHPRHLQGEADIVIIHDGVIILLEVKGGRVSRDDRSAWWLNDNPLKCPATQAKENCFAITDYCRKQLGRNIMGSWCCVFPQSKTRSETIEWNSGQFLDAKDMASGLHQSVIAFYEDILGNQSPRFGSERGRLTKDESQELIEILKPEVGGKISTADQVEFAEMEIGRLEEDQREMLGVILDNPRVVLQGGAGSGKTILGYMACIEKLRLNPKARVAYVCCSEYLAIDIRKKAKASEFSERFEVLSLPDVAKYYWLQMAKRDASFEIGGMLGFLTPTTVESWILDGPIENSPGGDMGQKLHQMYLDGRAEVTRVLVDSILSDTPVLDREIRSVDKRFDFVAVDEAQDFVYSHIELCLLSLIIKGGLRQGNVLWIQDLFQSIRPSFVQTLTSNVPVFSPGAPEYALYNLPAKNYRNPAGVTELANSFAKGEKTARSLRAKSLAVDVEFIENNGVLGNVLSELVARELKAGAKTKDIAIISVDGFGEEAFRRSIDLDGVRAAIIPPYLEDSILATRSEYVRAMMLMDAKGREFPIVILVDLPDMDLDFELNFMHVAITRAKAKLFVICGPERMATLRKIAAGEA
jgi:Nuclease-related domain/UvrD-like helicase C-terminal domain